MEREAERNRGPVMPWFMVDDQADFDPEIVAAGNAAVGLWTRAGAWSQRHLTEGFIPTGIARSLGSAGQIRKLIEVGLWHPAEGGYRFHQWRQMSRAQIEERREKRSAAGRKGGQRSGQVRQNRSDPQPNYEANYEANASPNPNQTGSENEANAKPERTPVPVLIPGSGYLRGESLVTNAREKIPPQPYCEAHPGGTAEPCGACASARKTWVASNLERDQLAEAEARRRAEAALAETHRAAQARADAIAACPMCRGTGGYLGASLCDHDPKAAERSRIGLAKARIAACRMCDRDGKRADGSDCDHKTPGKSTATGAVAGTKPSETPTEESPHA